MSSMNKSRHLTRRHDFFNAILMSLSTMPPIKQQLNGMSKPTTIDAQSTVVRRTLLSLLRLPSTSMVATARTWTHKTAKVVKVYPAAVTSSRFNNSRIKFTNRSCRELLTTGQLAYLTGCTPRSSALARWWKFACTSVSLWSRYSSRLVFSSSCSRSTLS